MRVRLRQLAPKPHQRADILPALSRFLQASPGIEIIWLSDGVDAGQGNDFVAALAKLIERRSVTVVAGGLAGARALAAADNAAGMSTVKVLRADNTAAADGVVRALDLRGAPLGDARFAFRGDENETDAQFDLPVEIRNDIARLENFRRARRRRRATARQALAAAHHRRRHRRVERYRPAAVGLDRIDSSAACSTVGQAEAPGRARLAGRCGRHLRRPARADDGARRGPARPSPVRRGTGSTSGSKTAAPGALRRPAARRRRRRTGAGRLALRRPHPRRILELEKAAAARRVAPEARSLACRCRTTSR